MNFENSRWRTAAILKNRDVCSLDFTFNHLFIKFFRTNSIEVVKECRRYSGSEMPSCLREKLTSFCQVCVDNEWLLQILLFYLIFFTFCISLIKVFFFFFIHVYLYGEPEVWPPGSADTVCPRPPLMTQVQHFVSRIKKMQRWDVQTMWAYDLDLWP